MIRKATSTDAQHIAEIYNHYVANTHTTFETQIQSSKDIKDKIESVQQNHPFLVYEDKGNVVGYAYATWWKSRPAYDQTVELSVYIATEHQGKGIGAKLYRKLIDQLHTKGFRTLIGGIALPNAASIALHEKMGFEKAGVFKKVGFKLDRWIDVGYWTLHFD